GALLAARKTFGGSIRASELKVNLPANDVLYVGHVIVEVRREGTRSTDALRINRAYIGTDAPELSPEIFDRHDPVAREHVRKTEAARRARFDLAERCAGSVAVPRVRCTELAGCV